MSIITTLGLGSTGLNDSDLIILLLTLFSMVAGLIRGFSREILSVISWAGSILLALHLRPLLSPYVKEYITATFFSQPITLFIIFFFSFAILSKLSQLVSKSIKSSVIGVLDRLLGIFFGLIRAGVVFGFGYMVYTGLAQEHAKENKFLENSKTLPVIKASVVLVQILLPAEVVQNMGKQLETWAVEGIKEGSKVETTPHTWPEKKQTEQTHETEKHTTVADDLSKIKVKPAPEVKKEEVPKKEGSIDKILKDH